MPDPVGIRDWCLDAGVVRLRRRELIARFRLRRKSRIVLVLVLVEILGQGAEQRRVHPRKCVFGDALDERRVLRVSLDPVYQCSSSGAASPVCELSQTEYNGMQ